MSQQTRLLATAQRAREAVAALQVQNDLLRASNRQLVEDNDRLGVIAENALDMVERQGEMIAALLGRLQDEHDA
jgi:hypothetical protein